MIQITPSFQSSYYSSLGSIISIGIAEKANKVRQKPLRVILNGLGKDAAQSRACSHIIGMQSTACAAAGCNGEVFLALLIAFFLISVRWALAMATLARCFWKKRQSVSASWQASSYYSSLGSIILTASATRPY